MRRGVIAAEQSRRLPALGSRVLLWAALFGVGAAVALFPGRAFAKVIKAGEMPGSDACAKIQNAINSAVAAGGGLVDARGFTGAQTCAGGVKLGTPGRGATIELGSVVLKVGAPFVLFNSSSILGIPSGHMTGNAGTVIPSQIVANAKMDAVVQVGMHGAPAGAASLNYVNVEGKSLATYGIHLIAGDSFNIDHVGISGAVSDGLHIDANNCCGKIIALYSQGNGGDGAYFASGDFMVALSQFDFNAAWGLYLESGGQRLTNIDVCGNPGGGIYDRGANFIVEGQICGGKPGPALSINGNQDTVIGLQFLGNASANSAPALAINGQWNTIIGNDFEFGVKNEPTYSIDCSASRTNSNIIEGNSLMGLNNVRSGGGMNACAAKNLVFNNWPPDSRAPNSAISVPAIRSGSASNTDFSGQLRLSDGKAMYKFQGRYQNAPVCTATDTTAANPVRVMATPAALTVTGSGGDVVNYICAGRN